MPISMNVRRAIFAFFILSIAGLLVISNFHHSGKQSAKQKFLSSNSSSHQIESKGGGHLRVELVSSPPAPIDAQKTFELAASVNTLSDLDGLRYEWLLPQEVVIVDGEQAGEIGKLGKGHLARIKIKLATKTDSNLKIHLQVYRIEGSEAYGETAQFNTRDQSEILADVQLKAQSFKKQQGRSPASDRLRIMQ